MWIYVIGAFIPKILIKVLFNAPFVKGIVVLSRRNKTILENIGVNKRKIFYIPPGIPPCNLKITTETLRKMRSNLNIPPESFVASYIGPVERIRGVDLLIRAFKMAYEKLPSLRLLILARRLFDSPLVVKEESKIMDLITKLGLNDVVKVIKRTLPSEEVKKFIALSDVIVLPFRLVQSEVPLSIMEALSQGKPVISTDVNGVPELISKGFGLVVKRNDPSALANALINIYFDKKIGKVSVKAKFLTWDDVALNMAKIINKVG
jgi:glycosyltransferase involved in cell wall biosynthesis